ncbi:hypothetical protein CBS101457_006219 [Exobasidium rhododendri]|nr:hypothetical protein CBS101457_006219 [Exobasidium rhododendri]
MSFGRPPTFSTFTATPPDRGSFPLDHDGDCKKVMQDYLKCMKANKMDNGKCRFLSKQYLECRMENGLMEKDEMSNLGFHEEDSREEPSSLPPPPPPATSSQRTV